MNGSTSKKINYRRFIFQQARFNISLVNDLIDHMFY